MPIERIKTRVEMEIEQMSKEERRIKSIMIGSELYTPEEILDHIKRRTEIGMMFL